MITPNIKSWPVIKGHSNLNRSVIDIRDDAMEYYKLTRRELPLVRVAAVNLTLESVITDDIIVEFRLCPVDPTTTTT